MTAIKTMMERQSTSRGTAPVWALCLIGAALLVTSASVHIYYYNLIYKNIATIGNLFLVQIVASFILAVALVVTRHVLVVLASAGLMAGTIIGFILVRAWHAVRLPPAVHQRPGRVRAGRRDRGGGAAGGHRADHDPAAGRPLGRALALGIRPVLAGQDVQGGLDGPVERRVRVDHLAQPRDAAPGRGHGRARCCPCC